MKILVNISTLYEGLKKKGKSTHYVDKKSDNYAVSNTIPLNCSYNLQYLLFIGESRQLDLNSGLFIGGIPWQRLVNEKFPVSIWSGVLKLGYVGCIRELILNDEPVDVVKYTEEQDLGENVEFRI